MALVTLLTGLKINPTFILYEYSEYILTILYIWEYKNINT